MIFKQARECVCVRVECLSVCTYAVACAYVYVCLYVYMRNYVCTYVCVDVQREEGVRDLTFLQFISSLTALPCPSLYGMEYHFQPLAK